MLHVTCGGPNLTTTDYIMHTGVICCTQLCQFKGSKECISPGYSKTLIHLDLWGESRRCLYVMQKHRRPCNLSGLTSVC